jgi:periplasmic protein TonB
LKSKPKKQGLADLIFNDRNKEYGAYKIIKSSVRRAWFSFLWALSLCILVLLIIGGFIRIPWFGHSEDSPFVYNSVSVKYDPSLITELSKPSKVDPNIEKEKKLTPPKIEDEQKEVNPVEGDKKNEEKLPEQAKAEPAKDSLKDKELKPVEPTTEASKSRVDSTIFVEQLPKFPGGPAALKIYIRSHLRYPVDAINRKVHGTVVLNFIVEKDGSVKRIIITKNVDPVLDFEAVRIIAAMPPWQPAIIKGKPAAAMIVIPIDFALRM